MRPSRLVQIATPLYLAQWSDLTADALVADASFEVEIFGRLGRFGRMAFVSDKQFVWALAGLVDALFGDLEVRAFGAASHAQALAYVSELPPPAPQPYRKIECIDHGPNLMACRLSGTITQEDLLPLVEALRPPIDSTC